MTSKCFNRWSPYVPDIPDSADFSIPTVLPNADEAVLPTVWPRRTWLQHTAVGMTALALPRSGWGMPGTNGRTGKDQTARLAAQATRLDPASWQALADRAVEAAQHAGAQYAEARLTRLVTHEFECTYGQDRKRPHFMKDREILGIGVRTLADGAWGFSASAVVAPDEAVRLAQDAVAQAEVNAKRSKIPVELGHYPVASGSWSTPLQTDPFEIPIEEKMDTIASWGKYADAVGLEFSKEGVGCWLKFARQERVVVNSDGTRLAQTLYQSGGQVVVNIRNEYLSWARIRGLELAGTGWEFIHEANIPDQFLSGQLQAACKAQSLTSAIPSKQAAVGKYTLVCDGATMASLVENTLGVVTQLDRALGYEANANGTTWIDDPLGMLGTARVASPLVTLTANRSAPKELATVKWDDEGVEPEPFTLVKDGILVDFQTTREQAAWLAPYYQQHHLAVRSHGCAVAESAHDIPIQQMPNLSLEPSTSTLRLEDLVADVKAGILLEGMYCTQMDSQARTGWLATNVQDSVTPGSMREIRNGKVGKQLRDGVIMFSSPELWKAVNAVGGPATQARNSFSPSLVDQVALVLGLGPSAYVQRTKGEPRQQTSYSVRAAAATISNQSVINPRRRA